MGGKAKVFIACCNRLLRESIAKVLSKKAEFEIAAVQALGTTSYEQIIDSGADVLVLDSMELLFGNPGATPTVPSLSRSATCVLVAMEDDHNDFLAAVRRGARGYVLQDASATDVVSAIRAVAEGQVVCPPRYTRVLFDFIAARTEELPNSRKRAKWGLTRREQQLIPLIGRGLSNKEIANYMGLSDQTIKNHVHRILGKVGVSDRLAVREVCGPESLVASTKNSNYSV
jgi:DNA-binding NarL/FixJ family response regulator